MPNPNPSPATRFQPGNGGRPKGSRNALAESFLSALHNDFKSHGETAIQAARAADPLGYCKMVAGLLPAKIQIEQVASAVTDDELLEIIRASSLVDAGQVVRLPAPTVDASGTA